MKKVILLILFVGIILIPAAGEGIPVSFVDDHGLDVKWGHPHAIPIVDEDGDDVIIKCDSTLYDVDVVIRDQYGNIMHRSTQTIGPNETTIYVPSTDGDSEKTSIDLYYDRKHLSGYFE